MARNYWLLKTEPDQYPLSQLEKDGRTPWTGVRNYQARNTMRDSMRPGDGILFYHSNADPACVAGLAEVCSESYPDPTQFDAGGDYFESRATPEKPVWMLVDVAFSETFRHPVSLDELRNTPGLEKMVLLKRGMRLSVQPVSADEWKIVCRLGRRK
jgi:predicted RNA-binding protein with PUA-like domain